MRLPDLRGCFDGVIPSIIATASADGTPNISYLSHVVMADNEHVALSNQFFAKTAANVRANPAATLLVVDGRDGTQFRLDVTWVRSLDDGPLFERVATLLRASSEQVGMGGIMRLKAVDIFHVEAIEAIASQVVRHGEARSAAINLPAVSRLTKAIAAETEADAVVGATLDGVRDILGCDNAILLLHDAMRGLLTTVSSQGYEPSGIGSEVPLGEGLIGAAASTGRTVKVNDLSRIRRFGAAIEASGADENRTRTIHLPGLADAMSQIATPMIAQGVVRGILFLESSRRMTFDDDLEAALEMVANQAAAALALSEALASDASPENASTSPHRPPAGRAIHIVHHCFDDSVFIDNTYVIKGVAGRLLVFLLDLYLSQGRSEFTNREIRLSDRLRLPEIKDNLETRLLLLRRRLDEKASPVRLVQAGRGRFRIELDGTPVFRKPD